MGMETFLNQCKNLVHLYHEVKILGTILDDSEENYISPEDVYVVWSVKVLQNYKALLSTPLDDSMYYEITYNGDKKEFYLDAYIKRHNIPIKEEDLYEFKQTYRDEERLL